MPVVGDKDGFEAHCDVDVEHRLVRPGVLGVDDPHIGMVVVKFLDHLALEPPPKTHVAMIRMNSRVPLPGKMRLQALIRNCGESGPLPRWLVRRHIGHHRPAPGLLLGLDVPEHRGGHHLVLILVVLTRSRVHYQKQVADPLHQLFGYRILEVDQFVLSCSLRRTGDPIVHQTRVEFGQGETAPFFLNCQFETCPLQEGLVRTSDPGIGSKPDPVVFLE